MRGSAGFLGPRGDGGGRPDIMCRRASRRSTAEPRILPLIDRYALPELRELFGERRGCSSGSGSSCWPPRRFMRRGHSRPTTGSGSVRLADEEVDPERAREIERESQHDVIAFLRSVTERLGPEGRWLHYGLTSSDVFDTATAVTLRDATAVVERRSWRGWWSSSRRLALQHRSTPMVGRSHGVHAEPITFGFKAAGWFAELERDAERLAAGARADRGRQDLRRGRHATQRQRRGRAHVCEALGLAGTRPRPRWSAATAMPSC